MRGFPLRRREGTRPEEVNALTYFPLSPEQESMYFLEGLFGPGIFHNMRVTVAVPEGVGVDAVRDAVTRFQQRQDALRTHLCGRSPFVQTVTAATAGLVVTTAGPGEDAVALLERRRGELLNTEQRRGEAARTHFELVQDAEGRTRHLTVALDHFTCDGNSAAIVAADLTRLLEGGGDLEPLPKGFAELCRDRTTGAGARREKELRGWTEALEGVEPLTGLMPHRPADGPAPLTRSQVDSTFVGSELHDLVTAVSATHESTPFAVMASLTALAIWRRSGRNRFVLFSPVSTRRDAASEVAVGLFAHDRPVVCRVDPDQPLSAFMKAMMAGTWRGFRGALLSVSELAWEIPEFGRTLLDDGAEYIQLHVWMEDADDAHAADPVERRVVTGHGAFEPSHDLTVTTWRFGFSPRRTTLRSYFGGPAGGLEASEEIGHEVLALLRAAAGADDGPVSRLVESTLGAATVSPHRPEH
ncbi:condensation domain-containing protein [Streptomyces sp. NBC_01264]|uniref:condensation domain-containing protein n=1 Tax=Streptomyces sp. NBC_01264 TaxID=2903804 RepID=UPI00224E0272|nr:condensation domain-containing protein [Streptomyces sp. NBC_01264]MCX4778464.1 condensation domain-containing protein [Streptomyces sp. NBC_01264]